jgi:hypothetical protein
MATAQLGVPDQGAVGGFPGHETGEALPTPVHEIEPLVLPERIMAVGHECLLEELGDLGDVGLAHPALDLDGVHGPKATREHRTGTGSRAGAPSSVL